MMDLPVLIAHRRLNREEEVIKPGIYIATLNIDKYISLDKDNQKTLSKGFRKSKVDMKKKEMEKYHKIIQIIQDVDEACLQDVVEEVLKFIGMTDKQFNDSLSFHFDDPQKIEKVKEAREEAEIDQGEALEKEERKKF